MNTEAALAGLRVIDLADESAVLTGRILADLGAEVILVEPPEGSRTRGRAPFLDDTPGPEQSFTHQYFNANKRSVVVDLASQEGRHTLRALVASADVLIETARPGELEVLELEDLLADLIRVSVTPFGRDAAWKHWRSSDLVAAAAGGLLWVCGEPGEPPVQGAANPAYLMASLAAATGVALARAARDRDPGAGGAHVDISVQEAAAMAALQTANPTWYAWHQVVPGRPGLSAALRCKDGEWLGFVPRPDRFENFLAWVRESGIPSELGPDDWPHARIGVPQRGNPVAAATKELAARLTRDEFDAKAAELDLLVLPITDFPYMERQAHYAENEQFFEVEHEPLGRSLGFVRSPVDGLGRDIPVRRAPTLGEHSAAVLAQLPAAPESRVTSSKLAPLRALEGVRVIDFCWVLAGPLGTRILSNFGADVIRVESTRRPDSTRSAPGPDGKLHTDIGGLFNDANTGKRSITIDLSLERGRELVRRLVARADVVTNNYRPGALERLGFGYDELIKIKPDIILVNLPGTHRHGPWSPRSTLGNTVMGASGYNHLMGFPHQRPRGLGVAYPDFTSPYLLATLVIAALRERARNGVGQEIDLSQLSGMISLLGAQWMQYKATGQQPPRSANRDPNYSPHGVYRCRGEDEWCALAVEDDAQFAALATAMQQPELATDERFARHSARKDNEDALDAAVSAWTCERERWELADQLQAVGIAAAPVEHLRDTYERDPQLRHHYQQVRQPSVPDVDIPIDAEAIRFVGHEHILKRAPMLGEHNEPVLCEIAGLTPEEFAQLVVDGVIV